MAFYEMLPGAGMPSGLQAGMDSVLNKKFGTSTTYPAEGWPDTVNLMGPLPEKTVSGAIVTFADGADGVPLEKCEVSLPASLDGYSSVDVVHYGKNIANFSGHAEPTYSGLTITANADGSITFSGTPSRTWAHLTTDFSVDFPIGTYTLGRGASASYAMYIAVKYEDNTTENISMATSASKTFTTTKRIIQIRLDIATLNQSTNYNETVFVQLEAGSTMTNFEPYTAPTTHTASLGRTIYGGTADVVKGQGESTHANVKVSDLTWTKQTASGRDFFIAQVSNMKTGTPKEIDSVLPYGGEITVAAMADKSLASWTNSLRIYDTDVTTVSELLGTYGNDGISYPLATPEPFTFDPVPIDSKLGNNTILSEQGSDTEVTYRADINLALGGN